MAVFINTVRALLKRPFIIIFWSVAALAYYLVDYNITRVLLHFEGAEETNILDSLIHILQFVFNFITDTKTLLPAVIYFIGFAFLLSVPAGLFLSGCFYVINNTVAGKKKAKGEFFAGVRKYFIRIWFITFRVLVLGFLFVLFMLVASVPAFIITKSVMAGKSELTAAAVLVDVLTAGVLFFGSVFFRTYILFWYMAAVSGASKPFSTGKKIVDDSFWNLLIRFFILDVTYILSLNVFLKLNNQTVLFILNWIFASIFFSFLITYLFAIFKVLKSRKKAL